MSKTKEIAQLWKLSVGVPRAGGRIYNSPDELYMDVCDYFQFVESNPLLEEVAFSTKTGIRKTSLRKLRAMTTKGLCVFLGITERSWHDWKAGREDLLPVIEWATMVIYDQKFTAAAAGLLSASLITRDLGLVDRVEEKSVTTIVVTAEDAEL